MSTCPICAGRGKFTLSGSTYEERCQLCEGTGCSPASQPSPARSDKDAERCPHCDGTGDVHRADGEWLGACDCEAECAPSGESMTDMVDAAMVEMNNIHPPLRRKECERLIRAALARRATAGNAAPFDGSDMMKAWSRYMIELEQKVVALEKQLASNAATAAPGDLTDANIELAEKLHAVVVRALADHRMVNLYEVDDGETGANYPLIDRLCDDDASNINSGAQEIDAIAHAAIDAIFPYLASNAGAAPAIPEGFVIVPINPTPKMVDATFNHAQERDGQPESHNKRNKRIYRAMLAAAPSNPPVGAKESK